MAKYPRVVYKITHTVTKRMYIGSTARFEKRISEHMTALRLHRHNVEDMQKDFDEYGDNFTVEILDEIKSIAECKKEYEYMDKFDSCIRGVGYNYKDTHNGFVKVPKCRPGKSVKIKKYEYRNAKAEMIRAGMTFSVVAEKMGVSPQALSLKLNGKTTLTLDEAKVFKKIVKTDLPLEELFKAFEEAC